MTEKDELSPTLEAMVRGMAYDGLDPDTPIPAYTAHLRCGCGNCSDTGRDLPFLVALESATTEYLTYILKDDLKRYSTYACKSPKGFLTDDNDGDNVVLTLP